MVSVLYRRRNITQDSGESSFAQGEYEDAMERFDDMGVQLNVMCVDTCGSWYELISSGIGFDEPSVPVDKAKSRPKVCPSMHVIWSS